jgi:hypothetical protein
VILSTVLGPPATPPEKKIRKSAGPRSGALEAYRRRSRRYDRAIAIGVVASVLAHMVFIFLSKLIVGYLEPNYAVLPAAEPRRLLEDGTQVIEIRVTENVQIEPVRVVEPEPEPEVTEPVVEVEPGPTASAAERLAPRPGDPRLRRLPIILPSRINMTREERTAELLARLYALIEAYDDSMAAAMAAEAEKMDWTVGEEGNKWGISPGQIHLGPVTLPLPFYIGPTREEAAAMREWSDIQRQAGEAGIYDNFDARVRAIRERKEQEETQSDTTSGGGGGGGG